MAENARGVLSIGLTKVVFRPAGQAVIDGVTARIVTPGITALIGPNGAGKSVCLRLIDGLLPLSSGSITFGERRRDDVRRAFVFQRTALIRASVAANVALAAKASSDKPAVRAGKVAEALRIVGLADRAGDAATHLSGGEVQRLAMARAIVAEPDLLLLDEPTASLDPAATEDVERLILAMAARGVKVLLVSHNLGQVARLSQDILVLAKGAAVEHGPAQQVLTAPSHPESIRYLNGELPWPRSAISS
jgi:tungstate transport system ATP-binding protein